MKENTYGKIAVTLALASMGLSGGALSQSDRYKEEVVVKIEGSNPLPAGVYTIDGLNALIAATNANIAVCQEQPDSFKGCEDVVEQMQAEVSKYESFRDALIEAIDNPERPTE